MRQGVGDVVPERLPELPLGLGQHAQRFRFAHANEVGIFQPMLEVWHDDLPDLIRLLLEQPIPRRPVDTQPVEGLPAQAGAPLCVWIDGGPGWIPLGGKGGAEADVGVGAFRVDGEGPAARGGRLVRLPLPYQDAAEIAVGRGEFRVEGDGLAVLGGRLVQLRLIAQDGAEVVVGVGLPLCRQANFRRRYAADGGQASTGSAAR